MTNTRILALSSALAAAVTAVCAPALARDIVVSSATERVASQMSQDLDRALAAAGRSLRSDYGSGYAIVRFERGADGRPANVSFYHRSGSSSVDLMARMAVRRLGARVALPDTGAAHQTYQANIVVATSERNYRALAARLARAETARLASSAAERKVFAFAGGANFAS